MKKTRKRYSDNDRYERGLVRAYKGWIRYLGGEVKVLRPFRYKTWKFNDGSYVCCVDEEAIEEAPISMSGETAKEALAGLKAHVRDVYTILWTMPDKQLGPAPLAQKKFLDTILSY